MLFLHRLPPEYRRRYYVNIAILIALIVVVSNLWRLGPRNGPLALLWLIGLGFAYGVTYPTIKLVLATPRPGTPAFALAALYIAAFAYFFVGIFLPLPAAGLGLIVGAVLLWITLICYRGIVFSSMFDRAGRMTPFRESRRVMREAKRASKDDWRNLLGQHHDRIAPEDTVS